MYKTGAARALTFPPDLVVKLPIDHWIGWGGYPPKLGRPRSGFRPRPTVPPVGNSDSAQPSPAPHPRADKPKMSAMATTSSSHANPAGGPSSSRQYVFTQEIARMAYVHCQLTDPDESTLRHIEDLVRGQLVEVVSTLALLSSRSPGFWGGGGSRG